MPAATSTLPTRSYAGVPAGPPGGAPRACSTPRLELLGSQGYAARPCAVSAVKRGQTPRYFYESFSDLEGLLVAVFDDLIADTTAAVLAAIERVPDDAHAKSRAAIDTFVLYLTDDPRRAASAFVEALGSERLMRRRLDTMRATSPTCSRVRPETSTARTTTPTRSSS